MTGESELRKKIMSPLPDVSDDAELSEKMNMIFMGTLACSGHATAIVIATGFSTEFGKTFQEMKVGYYLLLSYIFKFIIISI